MMHHASVCVTGLIAIAAAVSAAVISRDIPVPSVAYGALLLERPPGSIGSRSSVSSISSLSLTSGSATIASWVAARAAEAASAMRVARSPPVSFTRWASETENDGDGDRDADRHVTISEEAKGESGPSDNMSEEATGDDGHISDEVMGDDGPSDNISVEAAGKGRATDSISDEATDEDLFAYFIEQNRFADNIEQNDSAHYITEDHSLEQDHPARHTTEEHPGHYITGDYSADYIEQSHPARRDLPYAEHLQDEEDLADLMSDASSDATMDEDWLPASPPLVSAVLDKLLYEWFVAALPLAYRSAMDRRVSRELLALSSGGGGQAHGSRSLHHVVLCTEAFSRISPAAALAETRWAATHSSAPYLERLWRERPEQAANLAVMARVLAAFVANEPSARPHLLQAASARRQPRFPLHLWLADQYRQRDTSARYGAWDLDTEFYTWAFRFLRFLRR